MMDDIYREDILDHYKNPRNFGELANADVTVRDANASCGDMVEVALKLGKKSGKRIVSEMKFKGVGCAVSMAFASMLSERVVAEEWEVEELKGKTEEDLVAMLGGNEVSPTRQKCVALGARALVKAVAQLK